MAVAFLYGGEVELETLELTLRQIEFEKKHHNLFIIHIRYEKN